MSLSSPVAAQSSHPGRVEHLNSTRLIRHPAFTKVAVSGNVRTVYAGGQDGVDSSGAIVGRGDVAVRAEQVLRNVTAALDAAGAPLGHVVKWNVLVVQGQYAAAAFAAFRCAWGARPNPPAITVAFVAVAVVPQ